ncbi:hypothetical protein HMPREF9373_0547 [Psychrobacter sp. 1501(2011)]|nr:hypothetical protein HMPREF9373_0547 [Psychrobacter sp. 1501(2011)]
MASSHNKLMGGLFFTPIQPFFGANKRSLKKRPFYYQWFLAI